MKVIQEIPDGERCGECIYLGRGNNITYCVRYPYRLGERVENQHDSYTVKCPACMEEIRAQTSTKHQIACHCLEGLIELSELGDSTKCEFCGRIYWLVKGGYIHTDPNNPHLKGVEPIR
jgi:uncharacterized protein with PIN domain